MEAAVCLSLWSCRQTAIAIAAGRDRRWFKFSEGQGRQCWITSQQLREPSEVGCSNYLLSSLFGEIHALGYKLSEFMSLTFLARFSPLLSYI